MKTLRQNKIAELIEEYEIETQEELASRLKECGFDVTQATVSRDIRELRLHKVPGIKGRQRYAAAPKNESDFDKKYIGALKNAVLSMEAAENIIVIKTVSGMAMAVAAMIDALNIDGIMGCIAGDDTIMCVVKTKAQVTDVIDALKTNL